MDDRVIPEIREAERQLKRAQLHEGDPESVIDCLQRAQDAMDRARAFAVPPVKTSKKKPKEEEQPADLGVGG
jgi:hypothetical protein